MMSLGNIANGFLSTICRISPDRMVPLWMIIFISAFSLHKNPLPIPLLTALPTLFKKDPDFIQLRPLFGWLSPDLINKTFMHTTQYTRLLTGTTLKCAFKSPNPAINVTHCNEPVACDIVYANVPAIDDGSIAAVIL
jgi:hypothetical protein